MKTKRISTAVQRWGRCALTLLLACALLAGLAITAAARRGEQGEVVDPAIPKPTVTIQGNLVVEKGKPTGFYELALCVRSGRTIVGLDPADWTTQKTLTEAEYAQALAEIENGTAPAGVTEDSYALTYYPFRTATAAVNINADVLTAVDWAIQSVTYESYDAASGLYKSEADPGLNAPGSYPRGIDLDPKTQGYDVLGLDRDQAFPDITTPNLLNRDPSVAIDVEGDSRMFAATGQVDHYDAATSTALVTLSAQAPTNKPVILTQDTLLAVARFSYDLKRFPDVKVNDTDWATDFSNSATGAVGGAGFWLGWDKTTGPVGADLATKVPLTWLGESVDNSGLPGGRFFDFTTSDLMAAMTRMGQSVWVHMETGSDKVTDLDTYFYYYLGAEENQNIGQTTQEVAVNGVPTEIAGITRPNTAGMKVLTEGSEENPVPSDPGATQAQYTYFKNLLRLRDQSLVVKLVNDETFKKPSGVGGNIILFYDWDDKLIGTLNVGKGDVRAEVEAYIEANLVHPDLRPGSPFMQNAGNTGVDLDKLASLQREYTYRGKYAYTVGGDDATLGVADGKEYPLTNKLDYVFTKRVNTTLTQTENGAPMRYVHPYSLNDPALDPDVTGLDATEFPYVYGWAVVEDATAANGKADATGNKGDWKVMHDAEKVKDTWTTMGTGELVNTRRSTMTNTTLSTVGAVDPAAERSAPVFLQDADPTWTDGTRADADDYLYTLSGVNSYLRFADFSDITAELERYEGKNTLIVKAVYEEGESLMNGYNYTAITEPAYTKWNNVAASIGGSYRVQMTVERSYVQDGQLRGTTRIRMPVVQQDTTIDYKWFADAEKGINNDLINTSYETSNTKEETLYTQVDSDNGEEITFSLALSPRQNRVDYVLVERYGLNFVVGTQRSSTNNIQRGIFRMFIPDNYNYLTEKDSDTQDDLYDPDFSTKEGSHGFVLYGTLGHFLEQATKCNNGEIDRATYEVAVTDTIAMDANLRMDLAGTQPSFMDGFTLQDAFLAAATACEAHKGDPAYDCWDPNLDCAKLTYHQAQWFLLDFQANPGADILPVAAADAQKLSFCHYHISCSGGHVPKPPTTWQELMDTLRTYNDSADGSDDKEFALIDLEAMELSDLDSLTGLRSNATGRKYTNLTTFINALLAADAEVRDTGLDQSWVNMQYAILNVVPAGADADDILDTAQEKYWWYGGATSAPKIDDFAGLLKAAETIRKPVRLKDGDDTFLPKAALLQATLSEQAVGYLTNPSPTKAQRNAWIKLTNNLVPDHAETFQNDDGILGNDDDHWEYTYGKYPDKDTFLDLFNTAYDKVLSDAEAADEDLPQDNDEWWEALQIALLPDGDDLGDHEGDGSTRLWWKGGNTPFRVTNLSTLVECIRRINGPAGEERTAAIDEWNRLTVADIESAAISQGLRWKGTNGTNPLYPYDPAHPLYPYTAEMLIAADEDVQKSRILSQFRSAVERFDAAKAAGQNPLFSWNTIQYLLLNPGALPSNRDIVDVQKNYYWWKDGNTAGTQVDISATNTPDGNLMALVEATYRADFNDPGVLSSIRTAAGNEDGTLWAFTRLITQKVQGTEFPRADDAVEPNANDTYDGPDTLDDVTPYAYPATNDAQIQAFLDLLAAFRDAAKADWGISTAADNYELPIYTWQQIQYFVLNGNTFLPFTDPAIDAVSAYPASLAGDYWWYYADKRVPPEAPRPDVPEPPPNPAEPLKDALIALGGPGGDPTELVDSLDPDMMASLGLKNLDGSDMDWDAVGAIQNGLWEDLPDQIIGNGFTVEELTWPQMQLMFGTYARDWYWLIMSEYDSLDFLVNGEGAMLVSDGGYIPDEYGLIYPEIFGLEPASLNDVEMGLEAADPTPEDLSDEEILQIEAALPALRVLDPNLAKQVEEQLANAKAAQALAGQDALTSSEGTLGKGDTVSGKDDTVANKDTIPGRDDTVSDKDSTVSDREDTVPGKDGAVSNKDDTVADKDTAIGGDDTVSDEDDTVSDKDAPVSDTQSAGGYVEVEEIPLGEDARPSAMTAPSPVVSIAIWKPQCDWRTALAA